MLARSSSTSSCIKQLNENNCLHHYESLQNLQQSKISHPLSIDNNQLNLPIIHHKKSEKYPQIIPQDDIENVQERLNEMLISVPSTTTDKPLLVQQKSTNEYFTPKISLDHDDDDDDDSINNEFETNTHPFFDVLTSTTYEKEVMNYLLNIESCFMNENMKLRKEKQIRQLKKIENNSTSTVIITSKVRCKLIDWIISVHDYHRLNAGKKDLNRKKIL